MKLDAQIENIDEAIYSSQQTHDEQKQRIAKLIEHGPRNESQYRRDPCGKWLFGKTHTDADLLRRFGISRL